jgi:hypothetical protein
MADQKRFGMINALSPATFFPADLANNSYPIRWVFGHVPPGPLPLTSGAEFPVRLAVARGALELLLTVPVIPASTRFAVAFEIFAVTGVWHAGIATEIEAGRRSKIPGFPKKQRRSKSRATHA